MKRRNEKNGKLHFLEYRLSQVLLEIERARKDGSNPLLVLKLEEESYKLMKQMRKLK